jgi:hypothetical protein
VSGSALLHAHLRHGVRDAAEESAAAGYENVTKRSRRSIPCCAPDHARAVFVTADSGSVVFLCVVPVRRCRSLP